MPYQSQESEKEVRQATGFSSAGATTAGRSTTRQPAVEGQRTPGQRGSSGFQLETADGVGAQSTKPFLCPVFSRPPAGKNGHGNGTLMEAQPSEKMRLSQHLAFWICAEKSIFIIGGAASKRAGMKCTHGYLSCSKGGACREKVKRGGKTNFGRLAEPAVQAGPFRSE